MCIAMYIVQHCYVQMMHGWSSLLISRNLINIHLSYLKHFAHRAGCIVVPLLRDYIKFQQKVVSQRGGQELGKVKGGKSIMYMCDLFT